MLVQSESTGEVLTLTPDIESLDASNHKPFRQAALEALGEHRKVVLDLARLQFLDSSGLGAVLSCHRRTQENGGELAVCGLSGPVRVIFELVRMHKVLNVFNNMDEALAALDAAHETETRS